MKDLFKLILGVLASLFKSRAKLEAENLVLRQQINVLRRRAPKQPHLNNTDRFLFVWLYHWFPSVLDAIAIVRPETIIRWHRAGFRAYWRWRSRNRAGRPKVSAELRTLIGEMSRANPLWGAPRIHGELLKLGFDVAQSTVARYMCRRSLPPSQGWRTFLSNHTDGIAAVDLFVLPTIAFQILYCLVILRHGRRVWVSFGVTANPTAEWISRQITEAFPWDHAPRYLLRDRDTSYGPVLVQRLRAMGIRDRPIAFRSPWQNAYVERLIGSIRRKCLDHMIVFGEAHLRRILGAYAAYYNEARTHSSLNNDAPFQRTVQRLGAITSQPVLGGLHHQYCRISFSVHTDQA
jgi:transposase InsO family protein